MYRKSIQGWLKHIDCVLWDELILQASFVLGFMIRHGWGKWPYLKNDYRALAIVLAVFDILVSIAFNTMHNVMKRGALKELYASFRHAALVLGMIMLYLFSAQAGDTYSGMTMCLTAGFHFVLGYAVRFLWKPLIRKINKGKHKDAMLLVAEENRVSKVLDKACNLDGFNYAGIILTNRDRTGESIQGVKIVSSLENAADYICREWVDEVFICPEHLSDLRTVNYETVENYTDDRYGTQNSELLEELRGQSGIAKLIEQCREMAIPVHIRLPITDVDGKNFIEKVDDYTVLTMTANYASHGQMLLKRLVDIVGGFIGSIIALILIAVIGPKIRKESPGPILFKQTRIGRNGRRFTCYKLRSMYMDAEEQKKELLAQNRISDGLMFRVNFDPRIIGNKIVDGKQVTGIGEKIRSGSLDEFPQFFNVLKGDMSLVGTRPPTEDEWVKYKYHHRARLAVKPGLTGIWQTSEQSEITSFEEVVKMDSEYINNWSLSLDCRIILKTIKAVVRKNVTGIPSASHS